MHLVHQNYREVLSVQARHPRVGEQSDTWLPYSRQKISPQNDEG
ncbi:MULTISPECIES: hypothetical protein [Streptomyces]|uniref:Uncharacterized protein n=1 Tax=Streptomyces yanii TaxID=78510 RepID=A0ABV5RJP8_9ACTN